MSFLINQQIQVNQRPLAVGGMLCFKLYNDKLILLLLVVFVVLKFKTQLGLPCEREIVLAAGKPVLIHTSRLYI